jgi:hypothetical protein
VQLIYGGKVLKVETVQLSVIIGPVSTRVTMLGNPCCMCNCRSIALPRYTAYSLSLIHRRPCACTCTAVKYADSRSGYDLFACCAGCAGTHIDAHGGQVPHTRCSTAARGQPCAASRLVRRPATQQGFAQQPIATTTGGGGGSCALWQCYTTVSSATGSQRQREQRGRQRRPCSRRRGIPATRSKRLDAVPERSGHMGRPTLGDAAGMSLPCADSMHSVLRRCASLLL